MIQFSDKYWQYLCAARAVVVAVVDEVKLGVRKVDPLGWDIQR